MVYCDIFEHVPSDIGVTHESVLWSSRSYVWLFAEVRNLLGWSPSAQAAAQMTHTKLILRMSHSERQHDSIPFYFDFRWVRTKEKNPDNRYAIAYMKKNNNSNNTRNDTDLHNFNLWAQLHRRSTAWCITKQQRTYTMLLFIVRGSIVPSPTSANTDMSPT